MSKRYTYGISDKGRPLGEAHPGAKLSDRDVERIRDLHEEGRASYTELARMFRVHKATIADICTYRKRSTTPDRYRTVRESEMKRKVPVSRFLEDEALLEDLNEDSTFAEVFGLSEAQATRWIDDMD